MSSLPPQNPYIAGAALSGERGFFGREDILREVERTLRREEDNAIVLYGQRRIGKTSILLQLQRRLPAPPFIPIYFDLMDKARWPLHKVLYELAITTAVEVNLPAPNRADFENTPTAFDQHFLPQLYQTLNDEHRLVYLLDEFDVLDTGDQQDLSETTAAQTFFPYLRQLMTSQSRLNFVFVVGRRMEELSINFLSTFKAADARAVSVLNSETASNLILQAECTGILHYESAAVEHILTLTRGHPYLTQLTCQRLFDYAIDLSSNDTPTIAIKDVEAVIPTVLEAGKNAFQWIWDGLPPAERIIFSAIAGQTEVGGVLSEDDITTVLQEAGIRILVRELNLAPQTLVDWQMLERVDGGYRFFIELLRRWVAEYRPLDRVKDELDRINPLADTLYQAAQGFYRQKHNEQAKDQLRQSLQINPNHLKAHLLLGTIFREENQLTEAIKEFEAAYRLDEREGRFELLRVLIQYGDILEKAGNEDEALTIYDRALEISPREQTAQTRRAALWIKQGDRALTAHDFQTAIEAYRQADANKKIEQVREQMHKAELEQAADEGKSYEGREEWDKAVEVYRRLTELDPDDKRWKQALKRIEDEYWLAERYTEGTGYLQQKEWDKAQIILAEVVGKRHNYRDAIKKLAEAEQKSKGEPDPRRRFFMVVAGSVVLILLITAWVWSYSQNQIQTETTRVEATAAAQATSIEEMAIARIAATATAGEQALEATSTSQAIKAEDAVEATTIAQATAAAQALEATSAAQATTTDIDAATRVAIAIQVTELAKLHATETAQAQPTDTPAPTDTPTPTPTLIPTSTSSVISVTPVNITISPQNASQITELFSWNIDLPVNEVTFSPDGTILAISTALGVREGGVQLWRVNDGVLLQTLQIWEGQRSVAFSPDGTILATGSLSGDVYMWQVSDGTRIRRVTNHTGAVNSVTFSPDGLTIASGGCRYFDINLCKNADIQLSETNNGSRQFALLGNYWRSSGWVNSVAFSPDGTMLASGSDDGIMRLWDVMSSRSSQELEQMWHNAPIRSVAFSPDGAILASGSDDGTVRLWDVRGCIDSSQNCGDLIHTLDEHTGWVLSVAFSPDGTVLASGADDEKIRLWRVSDGTLLHTLEGHTDDVKSVAFSSNGTLVSGSTDRTVRLWGSEN